MIGNKTIKNVFSLGILQIFNYVLPLFTVPYLLLQLGAEANGYLITSQTLIAYFALLIDYGFVLTASKKVAVVKDKLEIQKIFSSVFFSKLILLCISITILLIFLTILDNNTIRLCLGIAFLQVIGLVFNPTWLFQGTENAGVLAKINITVRTFFYLLIFVFVKSSEDIFVAMFLLAFPHLLIGIICFVKAKKFFKIKIVNVELNDIAIEIKEGFHGFWVTLMNFAFTTSGILFLGIFSSQEMVGIYGTLEKLVRAGIQIFNPVILGLYPKIVQWNNEGKRREINKFIFIGVSSAFIIGLIAMLMSPIISKVFLVDVSSRLSVNLLSMLSFWFIINSTNVIIGTWLFFANNKMNEYSRVYSIGTVACLLLHLILIPKIGVIGVPLTLIVSDLLVTMLFYFLLRRGQK